MDDAGEIEEAGRVVNGVCTHVYFVCVCVCRRPKLATVCCIGPDHVFELYVTSSRLDAVQCVRGGGGQKGQFWFSSIPALHDCLSGFEVLKTFVLVSTIMTWARSKPVDPVRSCCAACVGKGREGKGTGSSTLSSSCLLGCRKSRTFLSQRRTIVAGGATPTSRTTLPLKSW